MIRQAIVVGAVVAACAGTVGCKEKAEAPEPVRPVLSTLVEPIQSGNAIAVGTVEPRFKTELGFRVLGRLIARPVNVGDLVEAGQTVAAIEPTVFELDVHSATAELSGSQARLTNVSATEARKRTLITTDATTKATLENAEQERAAAHASVIRAQDNLIKANEQLGYTQLKSGFAGVVTAVGAEVGQVVSPGQSVVTVARPDIREAVVDIGPDFPVPLRTGLRFTVSLQLDPTIHVDGQVREIAPQADSVTRTRRVRITLNHPPENFRLGTTVMATVSGEQELNTTRAPVRDPRQGRQVLRLDRGPLRQHGFAAQDRDSSRRSGHPRHRWPQRRSQGRDCRHTWSEGGAEGPN